jgi:hypothetical protein
LIDDTGLADFFQSPTEITSSRNKQFSPNEPALLLKMQKIMKFFVKKDHNQAHMAVGWTMTTDGKSMQFKVLTQKAKLFAGAILQSRMQRYGATMVYKVYYLASIYYKIASTRLSINQ